jgi:phosphotriesterase-related protein
MDMTHVVVSHMGAASSVAELAEAARCGAFLGIDKVSFPKGPTNEQLADLVRDACARGLERQLILSSDLARRTMLSAHGGRGYATVFVDFVPMLVARGIPPATIEGMLCDNPARMLTMAR